MREVKIRPLRAEEIDCRVATINAKGLTLLLYKDARVDQSILDEAFGVYGWQRSHQWMGERLYCTVSVRDPETGEWISKQDVGTESYTEKEKGQASDAFKRACFNLGIGRELYTAPFIWIPAEAYTASVGAGGKPTTYDRFKVTRVEIVDGCITALEVKNTKTGKVVYTYGAQTASKRAKKSDEKPAGEPLDMKRVLQMVEAVKRHGIPDEELYKRYGAKTATDFRVEHYEDFKRTGEAWIAETEKKYAGKA
nr:MAG TPA: Rad52/22 family double-strand break repair protein [Caudoviricetes sp.]